MSKIAFDTETKGFAWYDGETAFLASWADERNEYVADLGSPEGVQEYENALKAGDPLVAHNFSFDDHQTRETIGYSIIDTDAGIHDTDILARIVYPTGQRKGSYKLKDLAATFLTEDAKKESEAIDEMAKQIGVSLDKTPEAYYHVWRAYPEVMEEYAKKDARYTYDLHTYLDSKLEDEAKSYELEREVIPVLTRAEEKGIRIDQEVVTKLLDEYRGLEAPARSELEATIGADAIEGKGSKQALLDALLGLGVPLYRKTKNGDLATNKYALQEFEDEFPILKTLQDWRQYSKFLSTYLEPMDGREVVHTSFKQCEAWTGRMSSAKPNMQNIPKRAGKEVRSMFIPREDNVFVVFDYDSIEVRLLAWYMASEKFKALIREGHDPHAWMASEIHGGDKEEYYKGTEKQPVRDAAKNTLFAIVYGAGGPRVADMNNIPVDEARSLIKRIKKALPGYYALNRRVRNKIESVGYVNTAFGRRQIVSKDKAYVGLDALIQGTAAEIMKKGLVQVNEVVSPYGATPILVVHDEVVVETPRENAERVAELVPAALTSALDIDPPLEATGEIVTTNYADA